MGTREEVLRLSTEFLSLPLALPGNWDFNDFHQYCGNFICLLPELRTGLMRQKILEFFLARNDTKYLTFAGSDSYLQVGHLAHLGPAGFPRSFFSFFSV